MSQILGRARRQGSKHKTVYAHHLLTRDTQEEAYLGSLRREAALADAVWDSTNEIFAPLSPLEMLRLITS
jgi:SNF2 family DNA or RNA helicase